MEFSPKYLIIILLFGLFSCGNREGEGGRTELSVSILFQDSIVTDAVVYLKYGVTEFPGTEASNYNFSAVPEISGENAGKAVFKNLRHGNYYVYAYGMDNSKTTIVSGSMLYRIKIRSKKLHLDLPVEALP
jgi:hypothetical protein